MMPTWLAGQNSEIDGYADPFNLSGLGFACDPTSQEGDATAFLTAILVGDTVRIEKDGSNYREGVVSSIGPVGDHWEMYWSSVTDVGSFVEDDLLTVTHTPAGSGAPPTVSIAASTGSIAENGGFVSIIATMDATASTTVDVVVQFAGTATTGGDYTLSTTTISIASGDTSGSITATAVQDIIYEGNETFTASITSVSGGGASASSTASDTTVTIVDDDSPPSVSLSASTTSIAENGGVATFYVLFSATASDSVTVGFSVSGVAGTGSDYNLSTSSITIASGQTSGSITATAISDSVYERDEAFTVAIASLTGGGATASSNSAASVTILDDEQGTVYLTSSATTLAENLGTATLIAVMDATASATVNVVLSLSGTATTNSDYTTSATTIAIGSGATSGSISVTSIQDSIDENNETIVVSIGSLTGAGSYTHASQPWTFTITDDDPLPTVTISASTTSIVENGGTAFFVATLNAASGRTASVNSGLANNLGTATLNTDYIATDTVFNFAIGATSASIGVTSLSDILFEANETIIASLNSNTNCTIGAGFSTSISIVNEYLNPFVSLSRSTASITEASGSAQILASLDHTHSQNVTIVFGLAGTANSVSDYSISTNSIVIASGATSGSISITALQDSVSEAPETVIVSLSSVTNGTAASSASATTVTIVDDDASPSPGGMSGMSGMLALCDGAY